MIDSRPLPHNPASEKAILGAYMDRQSTETELAVRGFSPEWLFLPSSRLFWRVLGEFRARSAERGQIAPVTLLSAIIEQPGILEELGGASAISDIVYEYGHISDELLTYHCDNLKNCWQRRKAIESASRLSAAAYVGGTEFDDAMAVTITGLGSLQAPASAERLVNGADVLKEFIADLQREHETGTAPDGAALKTGFDDLDEKAGGLVPYFWLVGAETSGGKTALSLQLVRSVLEQNGRALVFALEMRAKQLVRRVVSAEGKIPIQRLMRPTTLNEYDMANLPAGAGWKAHNLVICDDGDVTIQEVRAIARAEHAKDPLACVVVDYIQLASAGRFKDGANREQEISFIGAQCVKMSKELGIPVIAPTQLNDEGKVRESRALTHHAAVYLVVNQDGILCAKNRDGERNWNMKYKLQGDIQTFIKD